MNPVQKTLIVIGALLAGGVMWAVAAPVAALNVLTPGQALVTDVPYGPHPRQRLDIYRPGTAAPAGGWPVAVFFYGGSWNRGERADYHFVGAALASRGVLTLVADYRLYPEVRFPDFLSDCAQALAYGLNEAARLGGNPKRVFVVGHSAGAYNAAMLAAQQHRPDELAGWVGLAGPYDFLPIKNPDVKPVFNHPDYPPGTQPIAFAGGSALPVFLGAAATDELIDPQRNTVGLSARLRAAGTEVTMRLYERVNHMTLVAAFAAPLRWLAPLLDDVAAFLTSPRPKARAQAGLAQERATGAAEGTPLAADAFAAVADGALAGFA